MKCLPLLAMLLLAPLPVLAQELPTDHPVVIDGDTLKFGTVRVRLYGIDAPETKQTCDEGAWPAGRLATEKLREIIGDRPVRCEQVDWDSRYGRPVSRCLAGDTDVSAAMVQAGMAWAFVRYSIAFVEVEEEARRSTKGIHGHHCEVAWKWRAYERRQQDSKM